MLVSGAGLLAIALVALVGAVRDADQRALSLARQEAERIAGELGVLLRAPETIAAVPRSNRFTLADGNVVVPTEVGWLEAPPTPYTEGALPVRALLALRAARQAEIVAGDPSQARAEMATAMAAEGLSTRDRQYLLVEAAWQAHRFGDRQQVDRYRTALLAEDLDPEMSASVLLLCEGSGAPGLLTRSLATAPPLRDALVSTDDWAERCREVDDWREVLRLVDGNRASLRHGALLDARLVLRPGPTGGAAVDPAALVSWLSGEAPARWIGGPPQDWDVAWGARLVVPGAESGSDLVTVTEHLAVVPQLSPPSFWANPLVLIVFLVILLATFGGGLFFTFRALWREGAAMRARADFLTSVTHELKTPLSSIRLLSEMLAEGRVSGDAKQEEYYGLLAGESARLTALIENVLDLGRMERGERAYDLRPLVPDEVVGEAVRVFAPVASRDAVDVAVDLAAEDATVSGDRGALVQALLNVLDNARKYAGQGERIEVATGVDGGSYWIRVRDYGPGIPEAARDAVFERFARGAAHQDGSIAGVGLGLYLARVILRAHGGDVECASPDGGGAALVLRIPLARDEAEEDR